MKNHEVATIKNVSSLSIADPTFFVGSPYRYDLRISEGDYGVVTIDSENGQEILIVNTAVDTEGLEWIDLADDIFVRSGQLSITAAGKSGETSRVLIGTQRKCCARISCIEKDLKVQGIRIEL
jgi:hypothetical protein